MIKINFKRIFGINVFRFVEISAIPVKHVAAFRHFFNRKRVGQVFAYGRKHARRVDDKIGRNLAVRSANSDDSVAPGLGNFIFKNVAGKMLLKRCATELLYSTDDIDYYVRSFADAAQYKGFLDCTLSSLRKTILNTKYATEKYKIVGKTNIPVLAIWGTNDKTMPYYQSERLKEVLPNVRLITYENSGHIFVFDEGQRTADDVLKFIKE